MDPVRFLEELLRNTDPAAMVWVAAAAGVTKIVVDLIKRNAPALKGNVVQTITGAVALAATLAQAWGAGVFAGGVTGLEFRSIGIVWFLVFLGAVGAHELVTNQNKPEPSAPTTPDIRAKIKDVERQALEAQAKANEADVKAEAAVAVATDASALAAKVDRASDAGLI